MRTIAIVNAKGGCGKTTIATSLAAALAWEGHVVALGDMDPQQSANDWLSQRPEEYPEIIAAEPHKGQLRAPAEADTLVLDTPAAVAGHELGNIVRRSQTILVPVLPSRSTCAPPGAFSITCSSSSRSRKAMCASG